MINLYLIASPSLNRKNITHKTVDDSKEII